MQYLFISRQRDKCKIPIVFSTGAYEIFEAEGVQRGTKIVIHLKGDCYDFAKEDIISGENIYYWKVQVLNSASHARHC